MQWRCLSGSLIMQDRFAGDIGDFGKYGLLRALARPPLRLGVIWCLTPDGRCGGSHTGYLRWPERYRSCDPHLFDTLLSFSRGERSVSRIAALPILPAATLWADETIPDPSLRDAWFKRVLTATARGDLIFLDPDNGIAPRSVPRSRTAGCHYVYPEEISALRMRGQSVLVYHHLSRRETAERQVKQWLTRLGGDALAFRFHRGGARAFFLLPAPSHHRLLAERIRAFMGTPWKEHFTLLNYRETGLLEQAMEELP
jgi:hypothetical protein